LTPSESLQTDAMRFFRTRVNGSEEEYVNPLAQPDGMPGVAFQWIEVEGPLDGANAEAGYRLMFGDLALRRAESGVTVQIAAPAATLGEGRGRFAPRMQDVAVEVLADRPREN